MMNKFLTQIIIFSVLFGLLCLAVFFRADGFNTDAFYLRFTSPTQTSLVIGTSRAAQGIDPASMNVVLKRNDIYNYSFSVAHSPYGPAYLESIKRKIKSDSKNGVFVVTVDPWSISCETGNPEDSSTFGELNLAVARTKIVNMDPNIFYLIHFFDNPYINLLRYRKDSTLFLDDKGWLNITIEMDSISVAMRTKKKIEHYEKNNLKNFKFSSVRLRYLSKTISFLQQHGTVYLVRLPVPSAIVEIENKFMEDFNVKIETLSKSSGAKYLNFENEGENYMYTDGNHLYNSSAKKVSTEIAQWILKNK